MASREMRGRNGRAQWDCESRVRSTENSKDNDPQTCSWLEAPDRHPVHTWLFLQKGPSNLLRRSAPGSLMVPISGSKPQTET